MKVKIYLDLNVMIDYIDNRHLEVSSKIKELKEIVFFPYSPAHIEEIANIARNPKIKSMEVGTQYLDKNLKGIREISDDREYLPSLKGIVLIIEDPLVCLKRVVSGFDSTLLVEDIQKARLENKKEFGCKIDRVSELQPRDLFEDEEVRTAFHQYCKTNNFNKHNFSYQEYDFEHLQEKIEILFNFLEIIGFHEDSVDKYRSNIHDNSHIMYGSKANYFVSGDKKTRAKAEAIYSFMNINTAVLNREEFLDLGLA